MPSLKLGKKLSKQSKALEIGAREKTPDGGLITVTEFKGRATLNIFTEKDVKKAAAVGEDPKFAPVAMQVRKAKMILDNISVLERFVAANDSEE